MSNLFMFALHVFHGIMEVAFNSPRNMRSKEICFTLEWLGGEE